MSIYRVDSSCIIESQIPRTGELFHDGRGKYVGDEFFINRFMDMRDAITHDDHNNLEERVKKLDDINAVFKYVDETKKYTLLHQAVEKGCVVCVRTLIQNGAKSDIPNQRGVTAEAIARKNSNQQVIDLIEKAKPTSKEISTKTVECTLRRQSETQILKGMGFPDTWAQVFEGKMFFGPNFKDHANVILSRSVHAQSYDYELKVFFKVTEMEYEGKQAFKIDHLNKDWLVTLTPTDKYLIGKDHLFVARGEEEPKNVRTRTVDAVNDDCVIS